jgi:DNA-binding response OmpR family regulator
MLTAESGKENVMKIVKMGVCDYVVKPFKGDQLLDRAKAILKLKPKE